MKNALFFFFVLSWSTNAFRNVVKIKNSASTGSYQTSVTKHMVPHGNTVNYLASSLLCERLASTKDRKIFIESIVLDNKRVVWDDIKRAVELSLKNGGPEWTFGFFDIFYDSLKAGNFDSPVGCEFFCTEAHDCLKSLWPEEEFETMELLISGVRQRAIEEKYENELDSDGVVILGHDEFRFGDESDGVSPELDRLRREAAFKILCLVRFVRQGISPD